MRATAGFPTCPSCESVSPNGRLLPRKGGPVDANRKLYRSRTDRKLGGVCGGLAQYFGVDATLIRVLFVVLAVLGGSGLILYLALWIIVPREP
jgi:phage shock protein C